MQSQKLEAVATLVSGLAHDFNNLLSVIGGNAELAQMQRDVPAAVRTSLDEIASAAGRAARLVQRLQTFGRHRPPAARPFPLASAVERAVERLRPALPEGVRLDLVIGEALPEALGDAATFEELVSQLLANAVDAVQERGRIEVLLERTTTDGRPSLRLQVRDDGCGMDDALRSRVFEPFFTTKPRGAATGLGLAVVHGIVRQAGGTVRVESSPGAGAVFEVVVPSAPGPAPAVDPAPRQSAGGRLLYIDDEDALVFLAERLLGLRGFHVRAFTKATEALDLLRSDPLAFDLVVTDQNMPGMLGVEVARAVREIRADLPVILVSGYLDEDLCDSAQQAGVRRLVEKPDTMEALCRIVQQTLEDG